jgi:putative ABC transport system permease protein
MKIDGILSADFPKNHGWIEDFDLYTFVLFKQKTNPKTFAHKLTEVSRKYTQADLDKMDARAYHVEFELQALPDVHFAKGKMADTPKGNKQFSYLFSLLAALILIIALLNYINLSTAKAAERAKEVGIRKVSGANYFQLMRQFLFESALLVTVSWILANMLVWIGLPFFNSLFNSRIEIDWMYLVAFSAILLLATLLLAGLYPAFILSGFKPAAVLKGTWRHSNRGIALRKIITITQFAIAAGLVMGATVIYNQMRYITNKDLGFNKDQLLNIYLPGDSTNLSAATAFQNALRSRPEVNGMTIGSGMVESGMSVGTMFVQKDGKKKEMIGNFFSIDPHFLPVFQIRLLEGRNLSDSLGTDKSEAFLVNEAFVKSMGWKSAIGQPIEGFSHKGKVVGVVQNFYYKSLHNLIEPIALVYDKADINTTTVKIKPQDLPKIKAVFKEFFPAKAFDYSFFDEIVNDAYENDRSMMSLFNCFTILAIVVSCLGLYGLVALITVQRTKEISIRKVLGASLAQLISLLGREFARLLLWALVIALPVAALAFNKWLNSYAYHIRMSWWMFVVPIALVTIIAAAVISKEIIKTALTNPVKNLRTE